MKRKLSRSTKPNNLALKDSTWFCLFSPPQEWLANCWFTLCLKLSQMLALLLRKWPLIKPKSISEIVIVETRTGIKTKTLTKYMDIQIQGQKEASTTISAYGQASIPCERLQIPNRINTQHLEHLEKMRHRLPEAPDDIPIGLLIGIDCPEALAPKASVLGKLGDPFAIKTFLGWTVCGQESKIETKTQNDENSHTGKYDLDEIYTNGPWLSGKQLWWNPCIARWSKGFGNYGKGNKTAEEQILPDAIAISQKACAAKQQNSSGKENDGSDHTFELGYQTSEGILLINGRAYQEWSRGASSKWGAG